MSTVKNSLFKGNYTPINVFHICVTLFFMIGFGFLPPFATLTPVGMKLLGLFIGIVYGYSTCEIIWPSLLAIILYGLSGYTSMSSGIASMMGSTTVFQIITGYFTIGAITHYGFGKWFVRWSLSKRLFKGKPIFYTWCFMVVFMFSGIVISQIPMSLLLYAVWNDIADTCGYDKKSSFRYVGMGGIMLCLMVGGAMIPYQSWGLGLANSWSELTGMPFNMGLMGAITLVTGVLVMTLYVLLSWKVFKVDYSIMKAFDVNKLGDDSKHLRPRTKRIMIIYLLNIVLVILGNTLIGSAFADVIVNKITVAGMYCLCTAVLLLLPSGEGDGKPCIIFDDIKDKSYAVSWPVIFMCAVTIPLASALTNEATGVLPWLTGIFAPLFEGRSGAFLIIFTIVVEMILTNVGSNIAFGTAMIPIVAPFAMSSGMDPQFIGMALIWSANMGLILPGASAPASIYHSREELPNAGMRTKVMTFAFACVLIATIVIFTPVYMLLG